MKKITNLLDARKKVLSDLQNCIRRLHDLTISPVESIEDGINTIRTIRSEIYEDLNQIQHEEMILRAMEYLQENEVKDGKVEWSWNPRQTGNGEEPDLVGRKNNKTIISAEITTSEKPTGVLDSRMKKTLNKLDKMAGSKYYFVRTSVMEKRALTKTRNNKYSIKVRKI